MKYKINEIVTSQDSITPPIIANFQNGIVSPEETENLDCFTVLKNNKTKLAVANSGTNIYHGEVVRNSEKSLVKTYIAVGNKLTKKMRIIEVDECEMLNDIYDVPENISDVPKARDIDKAKRLLFKSFGGKRSSNYYDRNIRSKTNLDVLEDQLISSVTLASTILDMEKDRFDLAKEEKDSILESILPPINLNATQLVDVYKLTDLIPESVLNELQKESIDLLKNESQTEIQSVYLQNVITNIRESKSPDSQENLDKVKICIYLDALFRLSRIRITGIIQNLATIDIVFKDICERFVQPGMAKRKKTLYTSNKTICYILVFGMLLSDKYEISTSEFITEFRFSKSDLYKYTAAVGAIHNTIRKVIALKLPDGKPKIVQTVFKLNTSKNK